MNAPWDLLLLSALFCLGILMLFALIRAIRGPRLADRVMGINMTGTLTILMLALLAVRLKESWLLDAAVIYAGISFLSVAVLSILYIAGEKTGKGIFAKKEDSAEEPGEEENDD